MKTCLPTPTSGVFGRMSGVNRIGVSVPSLVSVETEPDDNPGFANMLSPASLWLPAVTFTVVWKTDQPFPGLGS